MLNTIALALAPTFFVLVLGYGAGRFGRIGQPAVGPLNTLVMEYALPAALFVGTATAPRAVLFKQSAAFPVLGLAMLLPFAGWYAYRRRRGDDMGDAAVQALTVSLPNFAAAGLPIVAAVSGREGGSFIALTIAAGAMIPSPLALTLLELSKGGTAGASLARRVAVALGRACAKPIVWAPAIGVVLAIAGLALPPFVLNSLKLIGQATAGAALFLTGLVLSLQRFRLTGSLVAAVVVSNVLQPLLCLLIVWLARVPWDVARLTILCCALPSGFFGILFAVNYKRSTAEIGSIVLASTAVSAVTLSIGLALLFPS